MPGFKKRGKKLTNRCRSDGKEDERFIPIINGSYIGRLYALVALGYSMVYGIIKLINFAHGEIIMVGAYAVYVMLVLVGTPLWDCGSGVAPVLRLHGHAHRAGGIPPAAQ